LNLPSRDLNEPSGGPEFSFQKRWQNPTSDGSNSEPSEWQFSPEQLKGGLSRGCAIGKKDGVPASELEIVASGKRDASEN